MLNPSWLALLGLCSVAAAADTQAWKSRSIYFALTDRVAIDGQGGGNACGNLGEYCGGTFEGLQSKLDYIKGMGFDAIWITPVVASKLPPLSRPQFRLLIPTKIARAVTTGTGLKTSTLSTRTMARRMT